MLGMDQRSDIGGEVSDDDLDEINAQLALADPLDAVPFMPVVYGDFGAMQREFEQQLDRDIAAVQHSGEVRRLASRSPGAAHDAWREECALRSARGVIARAREHARCSSATDDGLPPPQHAGPGGHATPHVALTPRLNDQDPARA